VAETIDTSALEELAAPSSAAESADGGADLDQSSAEDPGRAALHEQIDRSNKMSDRLNQIGRAMRGGALAMLGILLGASANAPQLRSAPRWGISLLAGAVATTLLGQIHIFGFNESDTSLAVVMLIWQAFVGGLMGFWIARGHAA